MSYGHIRREDTPPRLVPAHQSDSRVRTPPSQQERLQGGSIGTTLIEDGAITTGKIAVGAITAGTIEARSITADKMVLGTLTADEISTGAITADKIDAGAVTATKIATNAVTAIKIEAGAITTDKIFAGAVTAGKIDVSSLSAITANIGEVTAGTIRDSASRFIIGLATQLLTVTDDSAQSRVRIGNLGGGGTNYGIEVRDAAGALILGATGLGVDVVGSAQLVDGAVGADSLADNIARVVAVSGAAPGGTPARAGDLHFVV